MICRFLFSLFICIFVTFFCSDLTWMIFCRWWMSPFICIWESVSSSLWAHQTVRRMFHLSVCLSWLVLHMRHHSQFLLKSFSDKGEPCVCKYLLPAEVKAQDVILPSRKVQLEVITVPTACLIVTVRGRRHHLTTEECSHSRDATWVIQSSHSFIVYFTLDGSIIHRKSIMLCCRRLETKIRPMKKQKCKLVLL